MLTGTIVNALAVLAGSVAGLLLTQLARRFSRFLPAGSASMGERLQTIIMQGVALCVIFIGISGSFKGSNTLIASADSSFRAFSRLRQCRPSHVGLSTSSALGLISAKQLPL